MIIMKFSLIYLAKNLSQKQPINSSKYKNIFKFIFKNESFDKENILNENEQNNATNKQTDINY